MAINSQVQILRGATAQASVYIGKIGELVYDIGKKTVRAMDGTTAGGTLLAKEGIKLKTDTNALLKFNAAAEADLSADITITMDTDAVADKVADAVISDADIAKKIAPALVSTTKTNNAIKVAAGGSDDGLLYVDPLNVTDVVKTNDPVLSVVSDKIQSNLAFAYTVADGKFKVTGVGGATIYETTIPTSLTLLKTAEVVTNPSGKDPGTYLHFVFDLQSGSESEVYVDVSTFIDTYTAGDGLATDASDNHKFMLKLVGGDSNQAKIDSATKALIVPTDYGTLDA